MVSILFVDTISRLNIPLTQSQIQGCIQDTFFYAMLMLLNLDKLELDNRCISETFYLNTKIFPSF